MAGTLKSPRKHLRRMRACHSAGLRPAPRRIIRLAFEAFIHASDQPLFANDLDGRILDCNQAICDLLGYSRPELINLSISDIEAGISPEEVRRHIQQTNQNVVRTAPFDTQLRRKDGSIIDVEVLGNVVPGLAGFHLVFIRDITARKQAEAELNIERTLNDAILNSVPGLLYLYNSQGKLVRWNKNHERMTGYSAEELYGRGLLDWYQDDAASIEAVTAVVRTTLETGFGEATADLQTKDGTHIPMYFTACPLTIDGETYFAGVGLDMTNLRRQQAELLASKEALDRQNRLLQALLENLRMGIFMVEAPSGRPIVANEAARELLGRGILPDTNEHNLQEVYQAYKLSTGQPYPPDQMPILMGMRGLEGHVDDMIVVRPDGARVQLEVFGAPLTDQQGNVWASLVSFWDITERKEMERLLRESEAFNRRIVETANEGILVTQADGQLLYANAKMSEMLGVSIDEIVGKNLTDFMLPEDLPLHHAEIARRRQGADGHYERRFVRSDGSIIWTWISARPRFDDDGNFTGSFGMCTDITERKLAEDALRQRENLLNKILEILPVGLWITDARGNILRGNRLGRKIWGAEPLVPLSEYGVFRAWRLPSGEAIAADDWALAHTVREKTTTLNELIEIEAFDGQKKVILNSTAPVLDEAGNLEAAVVLNLDISERKAMEDALRESEERLRFYVDMAPVGILIADDRGIFIEANRAACEMSGYTKDELLGLQITQLVDMDYYQIEELTSTLMTANRPPSGVYRFCHKDGSRRWWHITETRLNPNRVMAVANDVTERVRAEAEVTRLNEELEQRVVARTAQLEAANKELEAFSYSVSHDLRAPLRGIDGWSAALLEDYGAQLDEQASQYLHWVRQEAQRMGRLIDGILQLSRLTRAEMAPETVNLSEIARRVADRLSARAPERQVDFHIQDNLTATGDASLLEAALANLLDNAFKFTGRTPQARIEFGRVDSPEGQAFFVRDNGAGFDMAYAKKLFGAFQRVHKESEYPGSGIGLATVQRIIRRHGGRVWAEAYPNQGATFYFTLDEAE